MRIKKLLLDESLMDDFDSSSIEKMSWTPDDSIFEDESDDMIPMGSEYNDLLSSENTVDSMKDHLNSPEGPKEGSDTGVADLLITAINDEWEAIRKYNSLIASLRAESDSNSNYMAFVSVISEISNEENKHVGQLQELLKQISPNVESIEDGKQEGQNQLRFSGGLLQVESWDTPVNKNVNVKSNKIDDTCTLSNIDDEM